MYSVRETDYGTPARPSERLVTLEIDGVEVTVPEGTSVMRAAADAGYSIPKLCATDMLESFGSCRLCLVEIEGRKGYPASCTTLAAPGHEGAHADARAGEAAPQRDGAVHLRSPARLPDLPGQRQLRAAGHGRRGRPARSALRLRRRQPPGAGKGRVQPVLHLRSDQVHRLLALRARVRGSAGHVCADHRRPRLRVDDFSRARRRASSIPNACRAAPACRPAPPPR